MLRDKKFKGLLAKYNLTEEQALGLLTKYEGGGENGDTDPPTSSLFSLAANSFNVDKLSPRQRQQFTNILGNNNVSGNVNSLEELQTRVEELARLNPVLAKEVFKLKQGEDGKLSYDINADTIGGFQKGYNANANAIKDFIINSNRFSRSEKQEIVNSIDNETFIEGDKDSARDLDSILGNFTSSRPGYQFATVSESDKKKLKEAGITSYKELLNADGEIKASLGLEERSLKALERFNGFEGNFLLDQLGEEVSVAGTSDNELVSKEDTFKIDKVRQKYGFPILPDQSTLPPEGLQSHLKVDRNYDRLDPVRVSPEEAIKEINRTESFVTDQLNQRPDSQQALELQNLAANSQQNTSKVITEHNIANARNVQATDQINLQQSNRQEDARQMDALDFERRQYTALAKTQTDIRNFFNFNRKVALGNFNTVNQMNLLNDLYENFDSDGSGIQFDKSSASEFVVNPNVSLFPTNVNIASNKKQTN